MKKNIKMILAIPALSAAILLGCNSGSDKTSSTTTDTTSSMKTDTGTSTTPSTTTTDTSNKMKSTSSTTKKKGKVSTMMMTEAAATPKASMNADAQGYYNSVETLPTYPGGQAALDQFINDNVTYPDKAIDDNKEGTVIVNFGIDENGKVTNAKAAGTPIGDGLEDEAVKVINKMPAWTPGMVKGKKVKAKYSLPIRFQLSE